MDNPSRDASMKPDFEPWNGDNGASERPVQDNGTHGATFSVGGVASVSHVDYPLPKDVNSPHPTDPDGQMQGGVASGEVGYNGSIANYGFGGSEGGHSNDNTQD